MVHWLSGVVVAVSGCVSGIFVVCANAWMNTPAGFRIEDGRAVDIDVWAAMFNPAAFQQTLHMTIAAYLAIAAVAAGIHARGLLRDPSSRFHRRALEVVVPVLAVCAPLQLVSGDISAKAVSHQQPVKLAAMEGQWETERGAPLRIGGWPDERTETTRGAIEIPRLLSILAFGDPNAEVKGLKEVPPEDRPPVAPVHYAFQVMVGCGSALIGIAALIALLRIRKRSAADTPWLLRLLVIASPLGLIAIEAGWIVTEVGRQPWIVHGVMRTRDAVTPRPGLIVPLVAIALLYLFLGWVVIALLRDRVFHGPVEPR
jgi:cytochrome d ubiquinol oxidase subunit I